MNDYTVAVVPPLLVNLLWDEIEPLLQLAVNKRPEDIDINFEHNLLVNGNEILIVAYKDSKIVAVNTLEVITYGTGKKVLTTLNTGGTDLEEWIEDYLELTDIIGKNLGCTSTMGISTRGYKGRDAWLRMINKHSKGNKFTQVCTYLERKID